MWLAPQKMTPTTAIHARIASGISRLRAHLLLIVSVRGTGSSGVLEDIKIDSSRRKIIQKTTSAPSTLEKQKRRD
jgi:hypothetical protein